MHFQPQHQPQHEQHTRTSPVKLGRLLITLSVGSLECPEARAAECAWGHEMERRLPPNEQSRGLESESRLKTREHDSRREHCLSRDPPGYYFGERVLRPECSSRWLWSDVFSTWTSAGGCMDGGMLDFLCEENTPCTERSY